MIRDKLILASGSPRRRQLLADCGIDFKVAPKFEIDEAYPSAMPAEDVPLFLARLKSDSFPGTIDKGEILLTADTVVIIDGQILGKPSDREDAIAMLTRLSGKRHRVVTGVVMRSREKTVEFSDRSDVWFVTLDREEIEYYVDNFKPFDKAGSYGIQEWIGYVGIEKIEGSFYNIMGLPVSRLYKSLKEF